MPRILICDDDGDLLEVMTQLLRDEGVRCVTAGSLDEVVAKRSEVLDCSVAVLDVNLGPGRPSGVDVYRWLQRERFGGRVVFLTGHAATSTIVAAASSSGLPILSKPITSDVLLELARAEASA